MLWFIKFHNYFTDCRDKFKYILCYGSSSRRRICYRIERDLNTSYVMVHLSCSNASRVCTYDLNTSYVMVHLCSPCCCCSCHFNLNTSYVMVHQIFASHHACRTLFKYILCYGSSRHNVSIVLFRENLNTSYVMVHPELQELRGTDLTDLNTSYVMVHPNASKRFYYRGIHLNTSYVMVHHYI